MTKNTVIWFLRYSLAEVNPDYTNWHVLIDDWNYNDFTFVVSRVTTSLFCHNLVQILKILLCTLSVYSCLLTFLMRTISNIISNIPNESVKYWEAVETSFSKVYFSLCFETALKANFWKVHSNQTRDLISKQDNEKVWRGTWKSLN